MSHFSVLVIGPDVEASLAPFQENNMGDCPIHLLVFQDEEAKHLEEYEKEGCSMVRLENGDLAYSWDERFRIPGTFGSGTNTHKIPRNLKQEEIPHKSRFATFEEFMLEWNGAEKRDPIKGRYGYWENPNAKWDWYRIGGRWAGHFRLKAGIEAQAAPNFGYEWYKETEEKAQRRERGADQCLRRDIDLESMRAEAREKAAQTYDEVNAVVGRLPVNRTREEIRTDGGDHEAARETYWKQPRCAAWRASKLNEKFGDSPDNYLMSREAFLARAAFETATTFAVIKDGKWYARGEMGWWGAVSGEKDRETWYSNFHKLLDELAPETQVTVVDCHI